MPSTVVTASLDGRADLFGVPALVGESDAAIAPQSGALRCGCIRPLVHELKA
jgi:hypothetical protein